MSTLLALAVALGGLQGIVVRGPATPVCTAGTSCSQPAAGAVLLFERGRRLAILVRTDASGHYSLRLAPGTYRVRLSPRSAIDRGLSPRTVRVVAGRTRRVDFAIDTGIR